MRDPARIPAILEALRVEWEKQPDMRLGQLLISAAIRINPSSDSGRVLSYCEDDAIVEAVRLMAPKEPKEK